MKVIIKRYAYVPRRVIGESGSTVVQYLNIMSLTHNDLAPLAHYDTTSKLSSDLGLSIRPFGRMRATVIFLVRDECRQIREADVALFAVLRTTFIE